MSVLRRNEYREQLRQLDFDEERNRFLPEHREKVRQKKALDAQIEEAE